MIARIDKASGEARLFDVRRLTPRESARLMGVPPQFLDRLMDCGASRSELYKLCGNGIVCDVLFHIYKNIWDFRKKRDVQLTLFDEVGWEVPVPGPLNVVTLCSGMDCQCMALEMLKDHFTAKGTDFGYDLLAWSEFDPESKRPLERQPAVMAHNALFPQWRDRNVGDMTKADWSFLKGWDIDLLTYSTPCTDISPSGKKKGLARGSGTRSAILWHTEAAIRALRPKFLLLENVSALVGSRNVADFREWCGIVRQCGYSNYWKVLNAKDYGVPQDRGRVFMVSVRDDLGLPPYTFPEPFKLEKRLADVLDDNVNRGYFFDDGRVMRFFGRNAADRERYGYKAIPDELAERIRQCCGHVGDRRAIRDEIAALPYAQGEVRQEEQPPYRKNNCKKGGEATRLSRDRAVAKWMSNGRFRVFIKVGDCEYSAQEWRVATRGGISLTLTTVQPNNVLTFYEI